MKVERKFFGKWVAIKDDSIVASANSLQRLSGKIVNDKEIYIALLPKGLIAG